MRRLLLALALLPISALAQTAGPYGTPDLPFSLLSPWNIGVGSGAQWGSPSDPDVAALRRVRGTINGAVWGMPIYHGSASDPVMTVTNSDPLKPTPPQTIHIPAHAKPSPDTDSLMTFFDATQPTRMWTYWGCNMNGGSVSCGLGGVSDVTSDGVYSAGDYPFYNFAVGSITNYDLSRGVIAHALRLALSCDVIRAPGPTWVSNIPFPNTHVDYNGPQLYTGNIIAGATIGIPAGTDLSRLGLSPGGMMLAQALQTFGGIWRDSCGSNQMCLYTTPESDSHPLIQQARADLARIVPQLSIMRNQGPDSVNGGGSYQRAEATARVTYPDPVTPDVGPIKEEIARAEAAIGQTQTVSAIPTGRSTEQLADIQARIAKLEAILSQQPARLQGLPRATPGEGRVWDAAGERAYAVTASGSATVNGEFVDGGGDTKALTIKDGVLWGQDARNDHWFIWDGRWWEQQDRSP